MNLKTLPPITPTICPPWCADQNHDQDYDAIAGIRYQHHRSAGEHLAVLAPDGSPDLARIRNLVVRIERMDNNPSDAGYVGVVVRSALDELELSLADAQHLADLLLNAVRQATTAAPEGDADKIDEGPLGECARCGHLFRPDSSPNLVLCWMCDEAEAV